MKHPDHYKVKYISYLSHLQRTVIKNHLIKFKCYSTAVFIVIKEKRTSTKVLLELHNVFIHQNQRH